MKAKEVADLTGVSIRTLHNYDEIGLVSPMRDETNSYREYSDADLEMLQQVLFFRKLGFRLTQIKDIVQAPDFDRLDALELQKKMLVKDIEQMTVMIGTIEQSIQDIKGEITMKREDKFKGIDFSRNPYEKEAREKWGGEAVDRSNEKVKRMDKEHLERRFDEIYTKLANIRHLDPASDEAQKHIGEWYDYLNEVGEYTPEMFKGLGEMYVEDERFMKNIDQYGAGLAEFMKEAMAEYYNQKK